MHPLQIVFIAMMLCVLAYVLLSVVGWLARRSLAAARRRVDAPITSSPAPAPPPAPAVVAPIVAPVQGATNVIATPHNDHKRTIVRCAYATKLAHETGDDPAHVSAAIIALARVIVHARKADGTPKIGETDAIKHGLGISPGGSNPLYALARAALQAELARQRGEPPPRDQIDEVTADGQVVRRDAAGERYIVGDKGQRSPA